MTRAQFEARAIREAERRIGVPPGWWGMWRDVRGPRGQRVAFMRGGGWRVEYSGQVISRHDSRAGAIAKARRLK